MTGLIEVRSKDVERPTVAELRQEAEREEEGIESSLAPSAKEAASRKRGPVYAGTGPRAGGRGFVSAFIPEIYQAKVGRPVVWTFHRMHSISFRAPREAKEGIFLEGDRARVNADAWQPVESRPPPREVFRYPATRKRFAIKGGEWSGEGVFSSGIIRATRPATVSYSLVFSKAGTYAYSCLVHPSMRGKVEVT
jgi:plastocyanin